jgi:hypothetical protein
MADELTIMWSGVSGKEYKYWIYEIGHPMKQEPGNYIFAKEVKSHEWTPIYVGETDNLQRRLTPNHEKMPCVKRYGGTHIHAHTSSNDETIRQNEESDIRNKWNPPCNLED